MIPICSDESLLSSKLLHFFAFIFIFFNAVVSFSVEYSFQKDISRSSGWRELNATNRLEAAINDT